VRGGPARPRAPHVPLPLHDRMRHDEHRGLGPQLAQISPAELGMDHDPAGPARDVRGPRHAERFAPHQVLRTDPVLVPDGFPLRLTADRVAQRHHPLHEVVQGQVVEDHQAGDPDGIAVDVPMELHVVAEVIHAQRVPGQGPLVTARGRPDRLDPVAIGEADAVQPVQDGLGVRGDAGEGGRHRR